MPLSCEVSSDVSPGLLPLVTTFSHRFVRFHRLIKNSFQTLKDDCEAFSSYRVISAYGKNSNFKDILVRAAFSRGGVPRGAHQERLENFKFLINPLSGASTSIIGVYTLQSSNIVYCIRCQRCGALYIGEMGKPLLTRLKQHMGRVERGDPEKMLTRHFREHGVEQLTILGLETNPGWSGGQRKRAERMWINKLNTWIPKGLNEPHYN